MKSGLWFSVETKKSKCSVVSCRSVLNKLLDRTEKLCKRMDEDVEVLFQHNLKKDCMVFSINLPKKTLSGTGATFEEACKDAISSIDKFLEEEA